MKEYFKLTLGGILLLLLVAVSCYFWYKWETEPYREEYLKTQQFLREWTAPQDIVIPVQQAADVEMQSVSSVERKSVSTQHVTDKTDRTVAHANLREISVPQTPEAVNVSPYGFGVYPKIPASWPQDVKFFPAQTIEHELMLRVEIALTNQGIDVMGSSMKNGRVYPNVAGKVYVRWTDDPRFGRYISEVGGHPETAMRFEMLLESFEEQSDSNFRVSDAPSDIEVVTYDDSGIDPYSFLGL